jgi:N-acetylglutamate synthase-like GNAT family acetyltransferase
MEILKADSEDHEVLTSITKKSKAYWGFSDEVLKDWEHLLTVTKDYIVTHEVYKVVLNEQIIGYYSYFSVDEKTIKLDNIFILPEFIGKGFGKLLMNDFLKNSKQLEIEKITLDAEPNAEKFYQSFGFETIGQLESSIKDRYLPIMELQIERKNNG